jgi:hypothetical protein
VNEESDPRRIWLKTFTKDREFCAALTSTEAPKIARLLVYVKWCHSYMNPIQELGHMSRLRFPLAVAPSAAFWTAAVTGGVFMDVCMVPYLAARGLIKEAGPRRAQKYGECRCA